MDASLTLDGRVGRRRVGRLRATWHEQFAEGDTPRSVDVVMKLSEVQPEVLNPLVALAGGGRLDGAKLDADARFAFSAIGSTLEIDAEGRLPAARARQLNRTTSAERAAASSTSRGGVDLAPSGGSSAQPPSSPARAT